MITQTPEYGGTERHGVELMRRLAGRADCTIVCLAEDFYSQPLQESAHVRVWKHARIWTWRWVRFWRLILQYWAPVVLFPKGTPDQFPLSAYLAARLAGVKRIVCIEHLIWDPAPGLPCGRGILGELRRWLGWRRRYMAGKWIQARLVHLTVCVSQAIRDRLVNEYGYPPHRTVVVRNGADLRHFGERDMSAVQPRRDETAQVFHLLCVARLSEVKRIDLLLEALAKLSRSHGRWHCTIVGGGPLENELRAQARQLELDKAVTFTGHVPDTKPYVAAADVCILPSDKEGLPLSLVEAMAAGVPCIATDVGGSGEIVVHGQTGLLIKPGSVEELYQAIVYMMGHGEERRRMGEVARQWARQEFDQERQMGLLASLVLSGVA